MLSSYTKEMSRRTNALLHKMWFVPRWVLVLDWDQLWIWKEEVAEVGIVMHCMAMAVGHAAPRPCPKSLGCACGGLRFLLVGQCYPGAAKKKKKKGRKLFLGKGTVFWDLVAAHKMEKFNACLCVLDDMAKMGS